MGKFSQENNLLDLRQPVMKTYTNDQEMVQSEKKSHFKNQGGKKTKLTIRYLYKHIVCRAMSQYAAAQLSEIKFYLSVNIIYVNIHKHKNSTPKHKISYSNRIVSCFYVFSLTCMNILNIFVYCLANF